MWPQQPDEIFTEIIRLIEDKVLDLKARLAEIE